MSLLDRLAMIRPPDLSRHRRFVVDGQDVGWIRRDLAGRLAAFAGVFGDGGDRVTLAGHLRDPASRTAAVEPVLRSLRSEGWFSAWRDEPYPVGPGFGSELLRIERAAVPSFGVRACGVHVNGFVGRGWDMRLWVGRRSRRKPTYPGQLDHIVAGGQPAGLTLEQNLIKECAEEASIPAELARRARPVGIVSYLLENEEGLRNDLLFNYDLELPAGFIPVNADGEIEEFYLWPAAEVMERLAHSDDFKFNVAFVLIDFLIRHGFVGPDDADYLELVRRLRRRPVT